MLIDEVYKEVKILLGGDGSGHGLDHIERVRNLSIRFAEEEGADLEITELAALLHDADDYKLFGEDSANNLTNTRRILESCGLPVARKDRVIEIVKTMGYNKSLEDVRPNTIEGKVVSDADMCDAIGAQGIIRVYMYDVSKGNLFFDKSRQPISRTMSAAEYRALSGSHSVQHFFDKLLTVSSILLTETGREEGAKRQQIMIDFLYALFREESADGWTAHLDKFIVGQAK